MARKHQLATAIKASQDKVHVYFPLEIPYDTHALQHSQIT